MNKYHCKHDNLDFTSGMTLQGRFLLTGTPVEVLEEEEGKLWGEGICPNCGRDCKDTKESYKEGHTGSDPNQAIHDKIAARVLDPEDPLSASQAQNELLKEVAK